MPKITAADVRVPMDVPAASRDTYVDNYLKATQNMNKDFYGDGIDPADGKPEHLFQIGKDGVIGVLAGQRGLVAQYAADYPDINYLVKMNSKTNLVGTKQEDPYSPQLTDIEAVLQMRENGVNVVGLGYPIYLGSESECCGFTRAARPSPPRRIPT